MNIAFLASITAASLLGSVHCAGMCGPFVATYTGPGQASNIASHAAYNSGRGLIYVALGAGAGGLGHALDLAGSGLGLSRSASFVCGGLLMLFGLRGMLAGRSTQGFGPLEKWLKGVVRFALRFSPTSRAFGLGLSSALLPCGWLYAFLAAAASTSQVLFGAAVMAAFWLGTLPLLLGLGVSLSKISARLRGHLTLLTSALLFVTGIATVLGRLNIPAFALQQLASPPSQSLQASTQTASGLTVPTQPACHHHAAALDPAAAPQAAAKP